MQYRCLTSKQVDRLLTHLITEGDELEGELASLLDAAACWEFCLVCHSLFLARYVRAGESGAEKVREAYELQEVIAFEIQEGGDLFVNYMLRHQRAPGESFDEALIEIQEGLSRRDYARAVRY